MSTLLSLMDGVTKRGNVVIIGATNRPDAVDPALRRYTIPGPCAKRCKYAQPLGWSSSAGPVLAGPV